MLRPEMKPVDGTPGVGTPSKPKPKPEESKPSYVPGGGRPGHPEPAQESQPPPGPPAFDAGPSPYSTQEVTSYAQPPSSEAEARRREERKERAKQRWEKARKQASAAPTPPETVEVADFDDLGWLDSEPLPLSDSPDWPGGVPLSQGQSLHVDHLLSIEDDTMVREMLIGIKRDGIPPAAFVNDYLSQFAEWGWDDLSSARTLQVLETVRNSDWDDLLAQADRELIETTAQDLADNTIEGLIVIDAKTGETLLNRTGVLGAGGSQYVGLQDHEVDAFAGLDLIFVHNHPNGSDASEADLRAALAAGAEMLMVVTPQGYEYVYIRGRNGMVRVRAEEASYKVGPGTAAEHVLLEARSWEQARRDRLDPSEVIFRQAEQFAELRGNGNLQLYEDREAIRRSDEEAVSWWTLSSEGVGLRVLDQDPSHPYAVKIEFAGNAYWIDQRDPAIELEFRRVDLASVPHLSYAWYESQTAQVSGQAYDNTSLDFLNALAEVTIPPLLQSFVVDDEAEGGTLDIELSNPEHADRNKLKLGLLSRDLNMLGSTASFQIQSPVVGPDVQVEIVSTEDIHDRDLGNYVLISFPASVFLQNPQIMESLANDPNHNPSEWREGGRIFIGFAHLSSIDPENIYPEAVLEDLGQATIGWTGNTASNRNFQNHLDVSMAYFGPTEFNEDGFADAMELMGKRWDFSSPVRGEPNSYMTLVQRSNLYQGEGRGSVYGENIDIIWVWPQLDEFGQAENEKGERINERD